MESSINNQKKAHITADELKRIAKLSCLTLTAQEETQFLGDLEQILSYVEEIQNISLSEEYFSTKNINVFRDDKVLPSEGDDILKNAANVSGRYFVVPRVLKN